MPFLDCVCIVSLVILYMNIRNLFSPCFFFSSTAGGMGATAKVVPVQENCLIDRRQTQQAIQQDHELAQMQTQFLSPAPSCDVLVWIQIFPPPPHQLLPWSDLAIADGQGSF